MKELKQCPLFCCIVFLLANLHVSSSSEEQNFLFDGIHLQVKTMVSSIAHTHMHIKQQQQTPTFIIIIIYNYIIIIIDK